MENIEIAEALRDVADLLEIRGDNPFKVRAYRNAARTIDGLTESLADMVRRGEDLKELPAIGEDMAGYITELVRTGHLRRLEELEKKTPHGAVELLRLEGVGPKKAARLAEELDIRTIDDLERALDRGAVERLRGFGKRSAAKLRQAIQAYRKHLGRFRLSEADQLVRPLLDYMRRAPGIEALEVAGSYRRRVETIGDIDILAAAKKPRPVMDHFSAYPAATRVESAGSTRGTLILRNGMHVDLRVVRPESWGAALYYFTGSKAHNIEIRKLGIDRGLKINEYGVFRMPRETAGARRGNRKTPKSRGKTKTGKSDEGTKPVRIGGRREEDIFRALDMQYIPPEMREDRGEIEAARKHRLPTPITLADLRGDLQLHSTWSDGRDTIEDMAREARELGYEYIAITDHSPAVTVAGGLDPRRLEKQWKEIESVNRRIEKITVLKGMEVDILRDGSLDLPDDYLHRLDLVVVAVHSHMSMSKTQMTDRIIRGISHPAARILAHPTGRIINRREPYALDIEAVLEAAAELDIAIEINAQPDRLDLNDAHAFRARELGVKIAIDTDAHGTAELHAMHFGVDQARRAWLRKYDVINTRPLSRLRKWLDRKR